MKTSLKPYVEMLDKHAADIIIEVVREKKKTQGAYLIHASYYKTLTAVAT